MQFTHPFFFYLALLLIPLLAVAGLLGLWRRQRELGLFAERALLEKLTAHLSPLRRTLKVLALLAGLFLLTLALAGPQYGSRMEEVRRQGVDVLIALDVSRSMLAEDIKPNRLLRAQQELTALIDKLNGDRVGVIAFAGSAQVACPLTTDYTAAKMFLRYLTPYSVPVPGTSLGEAVRLAVSSFPKGGEGFRVLVLLTDGEDHHSDPLAAAREAKAAGVRILSIGFGTPAGEPIPVRDDSGKVSSYLKDRQGRSVVSRLDEATLKQMTELTGGAYWPAFSGSLEAERMADLIGRMQKRDLTAGQYGASEDRYQFVLLPAVLLLLFGFWLPARRRSWLLALPLLWLGCGTAQAGMQGDVNQGNRAYQKQQYEQALQKYQDAQIKAPESPVVQYDLGGALHRLGKYAGAEQTYRQAAKSKDPQIRSRAWYNLGNNFFQQQKYAEAIDPYRQALGINPHDADALQNLALALRFRKQPPEKKQPKPNQKPQDQKEQNQQGQKSKPSDKQERGQKQKGPDDRGEQKAQNQPGQETPGQAGQKHTPKPGEMSPEDASNLLDAVREAEQDAQRQRLSGAQDKGKGRMNVPEDW